MNKQTIANFFKGVGDSISRHSPEILTGIGIAGMVSSTVLAVRATPKAMRLMDEAKEELKCDELTAKEVIKTTWKCYIPSAVTGAASIACIIGASAVNFKRNAALATAYKLSEEALSIYKEKVVETIGEKKDRVIREKVAQEKIDRDPVTSKEVIIAGSGETLCYDTISSRYFTSDMETIRKALNNVNKKLLAQDYVSLNDFYDEIDLDHTKIGDDIGWNTWRDGLIEIEFSSSISKDGRPCLVLDYTAEPRYDYYKMS